ncbi:phosphatase [Megasphaera paucivorans]|uniref:Putative hydrolase n=1 Tax=Megasphaera paucivorans TaxID=349095 RepID=A0A1G9XH73_9FIRM|nr:phosphatase [Megasphaera paucivorans]SDM96057.1 putative hydrolase [Megasphaera paucivorans]
MPVKSLFDLHTHTVASGHAYSTLKENLAAAKAKGLIAMGTSDHSPGMPGSAEKTFFQNYRIFPKSVNGIRLLKGMEVNITDFEGNLDGGQVMREMEYVIASLHSHSIQPGSAEENTQAVIGAMKNPWVKIIGHLDDGRYPMDYEKVVQAASSFGVALELNNSSLLDSSARENGRHWGRILIQQAAIHHSYIVMGSDAHIWCDVGRMDEAQKVIEEISFPNEKILNYTQSGLEWILRKR